MYDKPIMMRCHVTMYMEGWNVAQRGIGTDRATWYFDHCAPQQDSPVNRMLDYWEYLSGYDGALYFNQKFDKGHMA